MTGDTIGQFIEQWGALLTYCVLAAWALIKMYFKLIWLAGKTKELQAQLNKHDEQDKRMEERLESLINRNKELAETSTRALDQKLTDILVAMGGVNAQLKLIVENRIKQ